MTSSKASPLPWTRPAELRAQVQRLWDKGELLRAWLEHQGLAQGVVEPVTALTWPLRLNLKVPASADLSDRFEAVRLWLQELTQTPQVRIEWREINHRVQGAQRLPAAVWLDEPGTALTWIGQSRNAQRFATLWQQTQHQAALLPWLLRKPLQALELASHWQKLVAVAAWVQTHPRPGIYLRQVDIPGVDSKFIESHRGVLSEWLDLALPSSAISPQAVGIGQFARRYGFLEKPLRIRFRLLDAALPGLPGCPPLPDLTLEAEAFAALKLPLERVFITENETNFLAFPPHARAMVIFGAGYGWDALAQAQWLHTLDLHYWGDLDSHGFVILDQLRRHFPHVRSMLMDRATLLAHRAHWNEEPSPTNPLLTRLSRDEAELYASLCQNELHPHLRLEQERIGYGWLEQTLAQLTPPTGLLWSDQV